MAMPDAAMLVTRAPDVRAAEPVLSIDRLSLAYGALPAVREVSLDIADRRITAIMGPSGCGKSTLIKALNRSLELTHGARVTGGTVRYRGRDLYAADVDPRGVRAAIGIIHQKPIPFPLSILENVLFAVRFFRRPSRAERAEIARTYLEKVGLWNEVKDRLHEPAERLSGGQQQRLCLARTLANQPDVLLMDEPCSALDPNASRLIEELALELRRDYAIVIVTHNMQQAQRVSDTAVFLFQGRLIEHGPTADIFGAPRTALAREYVRGLFG
jgi:phosphate transport system ATP-binding protein